MLAIVGETGSGKSTLAQTLALEADRTGDDSPQIRGGSLSILGVPVRNLSPRKRGRLPRCTRATSRQNASDSLVPDFTIAENMASPILSRDPKYDKSEVLELVATLVDAGCGCR